jgi:hypothetical protein
MRARREEGRSGRERRQRRRRWRAAAARRGDAHLEVDLGALAARELKVESN